MRRLGKAKRAVIAQSQSVDSAPDRGYIADMSQQDIIAKLKELRPALKAEGVSHLALFGSRARGDHQPDSDIDIVLDVDPESNFSILNLVGVEHIVADATGLSANAFMRRSLGGSFVDSVGRDSIPIF